MNNVNRFRILSALVATAIVAGAPAAARELLDTSTLTKYVDAAPNPLKNIIAPTGTLDGVPLYEVSVTQFQQQLHSQLPPTTLWGYNGMYPGPTFEVDRDEAIKVRFTNDLRDEMGMPLNHFLPYDPTLHGASEETIGEHGHGDMGGEMFPQARTVTHLHGGVTEEASDGYPEHWYGPDPNAPANGLGGPAGNSLVMNYTNPQRAAGLWYHDHAMGITRLNVYAGIAGFYFIRDAEEAALNLPSGDYEVPLMISDKSFYDNGDLYYPGGNENDPMAPGEHVSSFFGDANVVNGKVWPFMEVEPRKYRFRMLNAANTRSYNLSIIPDAGAASLDPLTLHQIGTDGGLLASTVDRGSINLFSADRADVVVDFSQFAVGDTLRMWNDAVGAEEGKTDEVMQFRIVPPKGPDTSSLPLTLSNITRYDPADAVVTRQLQLVRAFDDQGGVRLLLNGHQWDDPITENVKLGDLEVWEITNTTGETHPIHLHLEAFQVLSRNVVNGPELPLNPEDQGWEDTFAVPNGQTVKFLVKYDKFTGTFVWHCHILEHEDHEMMRPLRVYVPEPAGGALAAIGAAFVALSRKRRNPLKKE